MHALDVLGDPVRRRVLELLADGECSAGEVASALADDFGITQPASSQHLRVLREHGLVRVRADGARRIYAVAPQALSEVDAWLARFRPLWAQRLDVLGTEVARGRHERRRPAPPTTSTIGEAEDTA